MKHIVTKEDLKDFLKNNKVLITYTRDSRGNKNGVVVAIGKSRIGFSKVHFYDVEVSTSIKQIPYFQKFAQEFERSDPPEELIRLFDNMVKAVNSVETVYFKTPKFNRFIALKTAINRAISGTTLDNVPYSMEDALNNMFVRSPLYFK